MRAIIIIVVLSLFTARCLQPSAQPVITTLPAEIPTSIPLPDKSVDAAAQRTDSTKIFISYHGGSDADQLIELETTVITARGSVHIQSMGSRLDTTPVQIGATDIFQGPYVEKVHVLITGYFSNGTHQDVLETWI